MNEYYAAQNDYRQYMQHHGVKGMHWGIRRYQNYDGAYTQEGLKRFKQREDTYLDAKKRYNIAKRQNTTSKDELKKKKIDTTYDHLKLDKRADEGKKLYQQGRTIKGFNKAITAFASTIGLVPAASMILESSGKISTKTVVYANTVSLGAAMIGGILSGSAYIKNRNMCA